MTNFCPLEFTDGITTSHNLSSTFLSLPPSLLRLRTFQIPFFRGRIWALSGKPLLWCLECSVLSHRIYFAYQSSIQVRQVYRRLDVRPFGFALAWFRIFRNTSAKMLPLFDAMRRAPDRDFFLLFFFVADVVVVVDLSFATIQPLLSIFALRSYCFIFAFFRCILLCLITTSWNSSCLIIGSRPTLFLLVASHLVD